MYMYNTIAQLYSIPTVCATLNVRHHVFKIKFLLRTIKRRTSETHAVFHTAHIKSLLNLSPDVTGRSLIVYHVANMSFPP